MPFLIPGANYNFGRAYADTALQSQALADRRAAEMAQLAQQATIAHQNNALQRDRFAREQFESDRGFQTGLQNTQWQHNYETARAMEDARRFNQTNEQAQQRLDETERYNRERNRIADKRADDLVTAAQLREDAQLERQKNQDRLSNERIDRQEQRQAKQDRLTGLRSDAQDAWNQMKDYESLAEKNPEAFNQDYYRQLQTRHAQARNAYMGESMGDAAGRSLALYGLPSQQGDQTPQVPSTPEEAGAAAMIKARAEAMQKKAADTRQAKDKQETYRVVNEAVTKLGPHLKAMSPGAARDTLNKFVQGQTGRPVDEDTMDAVLRSAHPTYNEIQDLQDEFKGLSPDEQLAKIRNYQTRMNQPYEGEGAKMISYPDPTDPRKLIKRAPTFGEYLGQRGVRSKDIGDFLSSAERSASIAQVAPGSGPGRPADWNPERRWLQLAMDNISARYRSGKAPAGGSMPYYGGNITEGSTRARAMAQLLADQGSRIGDDPAYSQIYRGVPNLPPPPSPQPVLQMPDEPPEGAINGGM